MEPMETTRDDDHDDDGTSTIDPNKRKLFTVGAIISTEFCERLAYYGLTGSLTLFLRRNLNETTAQASTYVSIWIGVLGFQPLIGGYVADAKLGRFKTILLFAFIYLAGLLGISISAIVLESDNMDNDSLRHGIEALFWIALYTVACGTGGIKSNVAPLGAEQIDAASNVIIANNENELTVAEVNAQNRKLAEQQTSFFNWFYFSVNLGSLISFTVISYICQDVSFSIGYAIPTVALAVAILCYLSASPYYYLREINKSALAEFFAISMDAWKNRSKRSNYLPLNTEEDVMMTDDTKDNDSDNENDNKNETKVASSTNYASHWLDMAKSEFGGSFDETHTKFINDAKYVYDLLVFMIFFIVYWCIYNEQSTMFYNQGCQMNYIIDTSNGGEWDFPISSMALADIIIILILVPIMDQFVYPSLEKKWNIGFPLLQRIGTGFFFAIIAMIVSAIVEIARKNSQLLDDTSTCDDSIYIRDLSIFWQIPQYLLIGVSEVLASIASLEFFYDQAPSSMKSVIYSLSLVTTGIGSLFGSALIQIVNLWSPEWIPNDLDDGYLEYFFILLAVLMFLALIVFIPVADAYKYKKRRNEGDDEETALLAGKKQSQLDADSRSSFMTNASDSLDDRPTCCGRFKFW